VRLTWTLPAVATLVLAGCASGPHSLACDASLRSSDGNAPRCFVTSDGWILQGLEWNPNATTRIVLTHGLNEDHGSYMVLAKDLASNGTHVIVYDSRGHGASKHRTDGSVRGLDQMSEEDLHGLPKDLQAVASSAGAPFAIVGASIGANAAILFSTNTPSVKLVLLSPGIDYHGLKPREANRAHRGSALFLAAQGDTYAAESATVLDSEHAPPHRLRLSQGDAHGTNLLRDDQTRAAIAAWICCDKTAG
jgi:alpha-beta hydrolase superfamily lysophospholipase